MGQVYPRVGLDCVGLGQVFFPLLMNRVGVAPITKSVLKYINITSIAYMHCLLRFFCRVWFCWFQNSWVAWIGLGLFDPGLGRVGSRELDP